MSEIYGLLGESLVHSLSPVIHRHIFNALGVTAEYHLFEVEKHKLGEAVRGLHALKAKGINVTIPYKIEVMKYLDVLDSAAETIGAVNCISFRDNISEGFNTDYNGFGMMLNKFQIEVKDKKAVILGSGGAAMMAAEYFANNGAYSIEIVSRNTDGFNAAHKTWNKTKIIDYSTLSDSSGGDIIVNCTPCGMYPKVCNMPIQIDILKGFKVAVDVIYNPIETLFLKAARENGLQTANGLYMLVSQAVAAHEIWQGCSFDLSFVDNVYTELLEGLDNI